MRNLPNTLDLPDVCPFSCSLLFYHRGVKDSDIGERAVGGVGVDPIDGFDNVKTLDDFTEDGVLTIEMGCATKGFICLANLRCEFYLAIGVAVERLLHTVEHWVVETLAIDDVELACGGHPLGIDAVALARRRQDATFVEELGISEFGGQFVQLHLRGFIPIGACGRVARLNHETVDDAVKEQSVVEACLSEPDEIVAMGRSLVI